MNKLQIVKPEDIEKRSMEIITSELNGRTWPEPQFSIIKGAFTLLQILNMQIICVSPRVPLR